MKLSLRSSLVLLKIKTRDWMFMYLLLVVMQQIFKVCKASLIFTFISTINNMFQVKLMVGGVMGVYNFHQKDIATHAHHLNQFVFPLFLYSGSFHQYQDQFMLFHKNLSDLNAGEQKGSDQHGHHMLSSFGTCLF